VENKRRTLNGVKMEEEESVKKRQEREEGEDGRRAKYQGACQCGGLMVGGGGTFLFVIK